MTMDRDTQREFRKLGTQLGRVEGEVKVLHNRVKGLELSRVWRNTQFATLATLIASDVIAHFMK